MMTSSAASEDSSSSAVREEPPLGTDLSGEGEPAKPDVDTANALLSDAKMRTHYRTAATALAFLLVFFLAHSMYRVVRALARDPTLISAPAVTLVAALVFAVAGLAIGLLHATFSSPGEKKASVAAAVDVIPGPKVTVEVMKGLKDVLDVLIKSGDKKG